jgi:glycosyltransferase involved in cell wall biosynthesis
MRVAFVDQSGDDIGGAQVSLALLLRYLPPSLDPDVVLFGEGRYAEHLRAMGLRVHILPAPKILSSATREKISLRAALAAQWMVLELARVLARLKPAVAHTNSVKAHVVGGAAARICNVPSVAHFRDVLEGRGRSVVRNVAQATSRERIAISELVASSYALPRTSVIENPLDLDAYAALPRKDEARAKLGLPQEKPIVALVGRINRWKGHDRFLRAAARVPAPLQAHFVIAGEPRFRDSDFLPELRRLVGTLGLEDRVTFVDWLDDPRVLFAASDVNVNCSTREPFGRTIIEAAAAGVPTVCFDDAGVAEFMRDGLTGTIVPAGDEERLAAAIAASAAMDPASRKEAGARAKHWSRRFTADRHAAQVGEVLARASVRAGPPPRPPRDGSL